MINALVQVRKHNRHEVRLCCDGNGGGGASEGEGWMYRSSFFVCERVHTNTHQRVWNLGSRLTPQSDDQSMGLCAFESDSSSQAVHASSVGPPTHRL